jgi:membrane protein YdbS with pleckstrin-like domain
LDWYKKQIKIIVVMLVGIVIVSKIYYGFNLDRWEFIKATGIVIVIGIIFELLIMLIMYLYTKIKYGDSHKLK